MGGNEYCAGGIDEHGRGSGTALLYPDEEYYDVYAAALVITAMSIAPAASTNTGMAV